MSLENTINQEIKNAMLAKKQARLEALRAVKAAILLEKTKSTAVAELSHEDEVKLLQRLVKQRKESAEIYKNGGRQDLADIELDQAGVIEEFLPMQLDISEVRTLVSQIIQQTGAQSMKDMGKVMGEASRLMAGKSDNKTISAIVKELLAGV